MDKYTDIPLTADLAIYRNMIKDPEIYGEEEREKIEELPDKQRAPFIVARFEMFMAQYPEYDHFVRTEIAENPQAMLDFSRGITKEHLEEAGIDSESVNEVFEELQTNIAKVEAIEESGLHTNPLLEAIKENISTADLAAAIVDDPERKEKLLRIKRAAEKQLARTISQQEERRKKRESNLEFWDVLILRDQFTESVLMRLYYLQNPIKSGRAEHILQPLDKINSGVWKLLKEATDGQITVTVNMLPSQPEKEATAFYAIGFDGLDDIRITRRLTLFDKRVYCAVSALYNNGSKRMTLTQIHYAMGNSGTPAKYHLKKINDSLTKMRHADIILDTLEESKQLENYPRYEYSGYLLPMERVVEIINDEVTEGAIFLYREPPLMTFAKQRKQFTTIEMKVLQSPISKTESNLTIEDYLLERISREKRTKKSCTIVFETLFKAVRMDTPKKRTRAKETITRYLNHYKSVGFIRGFKVEKTKLKIEL